MYSRYIAYSEECPVTNNYSSPDGSKKAYVRLTPDVDALDIAATKLALV